VFGVRTLTTVSMCVVRVRGCRLVLWPGNVGPVGRLAGASHAYAAVVRADRRASQLGVVDERRRTVTAAATTTDRQRHAPPSRHALAAVTQRHLTTTPP